MDYADSEPILSTTFCIDSIVLGILENYVKEADDSALGETTYLEEVIGVYL